MRRDVWLLVKKRIRGAGARCGPLRSSKSGKNGSTSVETTGHQWVRACEASCQFAVLSSLSLAGAAVSLYRQGARSGIMRGSWEVTGD